MPLLELQNLKTTFATEDGDVPAVQGVDLKVQRGTRHALIGQTGAGKSILALSVLRLLPENAHISGKVLFQGQDLLTCPAQTMQRIRGSKIMMVFQNPDASLNPRMKLKDNILEPLRYYKKCANGDERDILDRYCRMAELPENLLSRYPHEVSGGENQRAVIARMLTLQPKLLIADEPTSSLDILVQAQILQLLKRVQQRLRITLLFISHDLQAIAYMCDQVAVMRSGQIVEKGACRQLFSTPRTPYCRDLVKNAFTPWRFAS